MVKAILFDFWGTLVEQGVWSPVKQVRNILGIGMPFSEYITRMESSFMTREFPSLKDGFENMCFEFGLSPQEKKTEDLIGLWNKSWMLAEPYPETIESLKKLRENHKLVLFCNADNFSVNQVLDKFGLREIFDHIFFSYELGLIKTDNLFFKTVLNKIGLEPADCILVGDSIQSDIIPGRRADLDVILVDRKNNRDFHPKIKTLTDLEKLI
tara:strand:+ start:356 stop:988 length:633 start_codon:yes stop_codon:yes gene_type:complete